MVFLYECPNCKELFTSIEWDNATILGCNRTRKRHFKSLESVPTPKDFLYKCPCCLNYYPRYQISKSHLNDEDIIKY